MTQTSVDHVLITRFNLPSAGYEHTVRSRDGWLESRVGLFERYCLPSVESQTTREFEWLVYFDPESPRWLRRRIEGWACMTPVFRTQVTSEDLLADLHRVSGGKRERVLTTNLDNDDALAADFVARVQAVSPEPGATAIYLAHGLIATGDRLYQRTDKVNAFCSVSAPWREPRTCWAEWHNRLGRIMPVKLDLGTPGWLQVVHGGNVSNRVHGRLTSPRLHSDLFPGLLDAFPEPGLRERLRDGWIDQPTRLVREAGRGFVKRAIVATAGRGALDRVRTRMRIGAGLGGLSGRSET